MTMLVLALPSSAAAAPRPATPELIQQAQSHGEISGTRATQLRAYALAAPRKLPSAYRSSTPWDGTLILRRIHGALPKLKDSAAKRETAALAGPSAKAVTSCNKSVGNLTTQVDTAHFHVEYGLAPGGGLSVGDYTTSLETTWGTEITGFGWAAPPLKSTFPGKYYVRIDDINSGADSGLYGYVSASGTAAGPYGNNPNTPWNDVDAYSSCMVLDDDYSQGFPNNFPSAPQDSLDSTTAHEFNHSIQYGYGALTGTNQASESFTEAGASWMEDEVYDSSNDNYNYLWPDFRQGLANYDPSYPYPDWIALRGITEPYGSNSPDGGESVMQRFWELTSQGEGGAPNSPNAGNLNSMEQAVADKGGNLPASYENYAIAVKFSKSCGAGNGSAPPDCFEEGAGYLSAPFTGGRPTPDRSISAIGGSATDTISDGYAIQWTSLPSAGPYDVRLANASSGGQLRARVACDPGSGSSLRLSATLGPVGAGASATARDFDPSGCSSPVLVTTNSAHSTPNPAAPASRPIEVSTFAASSAPPDSTGTTTSVSPGSSTPTTTPVIDLPPSLSTPRLSHTRFRGSPARGRTPAVGTRVRYTLSEAARVSFRVDRRRSGRWRRSGSFTKAGRAGANSFRFNGRLRGRKLKPGLYRFVVYARDATGHRSVTRRKSFRILAP